jgi:hypothetical protein
MAEIVNLRQARRRRDRARHEAEAAANRAKFGRTGAVKKADANNAERAERILDGARLDDEPKER